MVRKSAISEVKTERRKDETSGEMRSVRMGLIIAFDN